MKNFKNTLILFISVTYLSSLASALPTDPDCLNVPNEAAVKAWKIEGLAELLGQEEKVEEKVQINKASLFGTGYIFSDIVYLAPDLETAETPEAFVAQYKDFISKIPNGYQLYHLSSDPQNGLKYAIFRPAAGSQYAPWVLSVAGTQTLLDKIVDGLMGRAQMDRLSQLFTKCLFQNEKGQTVLDIPLVFVGHSLGGGLAQALYHQIQGRLSALRGRGYASPLSLVTFNAFGGQELLAQINVPFNQQYVENYRVENYFIKGDIVSRVGTHIGPTYELLPYDSRTGKVRNLSVGVAHALNTVSVLTKENATMHLPMPTVPKAPDFLYTINKFYQAQKDKALGLALFLAPKINYLVKSNSGKIANFLENTAAHVADLGVKSQENINLMNYVQLLGEDEELRLRSRFSLTGNANSLADNLRRSLNESSEKLNSQPGALLDYLMKRKRQE